MESLQCGQMVELVLTITPIDTHYLYSAVALMQFQLFYLHNLNCDLIMCRDSVCLIGGPGANHDAQWHKEALLLLQ